ncbi:hypothetical protein BJM39_09275 [Salmonella enterica subsp. enterica serovar Javiana]|nr:hypothetical protein BJM39_09275 [Salmonella enterica subsp. enterica serovar Javiana]
MHEELGYGLDPSTIGAVEDFAPGVTAGVVLQALRQEYTRRLDPTPVALTAGQLQAVAESAQPVKTRT